MTFVTSAHQKSVAQKTNFLDLGKFSTGKIVFGLNFLGTLFAKVMCKFSKAVQKDGFFDAPLDLFKEKKFSSLSKDNEQILDFHLPFQNFYSTHRNYEILSKSLLSLLKSHSSQ
jgi:hypothetical protein